MKFEDALIGDVWLCGGQSNMQFDLSGAHNAAEVLPKADDPQLRYFNVPLNPKMEPQADAAGRWVVCTPSTAGKFSAVGYFFARELRARLGRPVGLIGSSWGGTTAEAWTSLPALKSDPALKFYLGKFDEVKAKYPQAAAEYLTRHAAFGQTQARWRKEVEPASYAALKQAGLPASPFRTDDWDDVIKQPDPAPAKDGPTATYAPAPSDIR